jgi:hypothetical protein
MTIYEELKEAGVELDHHCSDLYAKKCPASEAIVARYKFKTNVTLFRSQIDGEPWYDIPFAFDPQWDNRSVVVKCARE